MAFSSILLLLLAIGSGLCHFPTSLTPGCARLSACTSLLSTFDYLNGIPLVEIFQGDSGANLAAICSHVPAARACVVGGISQCQSFLARRVFNTLELGTFVCDPGNREFMANLRQSQCLTDPAQRFTLVRTMDGCTFDYMRNEGRLRYTAFSAGRTPEPLEYCPLLETQHRCMLQNATLLCGSDASVTQFVSTVWHFATRNAVVPTVLPCYPDMDRTGTPVVQASNQR